MVEGRTVERLAAHFGVEGSIERAFRARAGRTVAGVEETSDIMRTFRGVTVEEFERVCAQADLRRGAEAAVAGLREMGFEVGIVTATYEAAAHAAAARLGIAEDLVVAVRPRTDGERLTGQIHPSGHEGPCGAFICKAEALAALAGHGPAFTVAVGDGLNDVCMLDRSDIGVAVEPCAAKVRLHADVVVRDLRALPAVVRQRLGRQGEEGAVRAPA